MVSTALLLNLAQDLVLSEQEHLVVAVLHGDTSEVGQKNLVTSDLME